jgi:hypothetical protein
MATVGSTIVIAWQQQDTQGYDTVWARVSNDGGTTWEPAEQLANVPGANASEVSLTADPVNGGIVAIWSEGIDVWTAYYFAPGPWHPGYKIATTSSPVTLPSVAVGGPYTFYTYVEWDAFGNPSARLVVGDNFGTLAPAIDLGQSWPGERPRVAATSQSVVVVWTDANSKVRVRRGTFGAGTAPPINWSTSDLGAGYNTLLALSGDHGVITWFKKSGTFAASTSDGGATWSVPVQLREKPEKYYFDSVSDVAMFGQEATITGTNGSVAAGPGFGTGFRLISTDGGTTWSETQSFPYGGDSRQVAYVDASTGGTKLAEAWLHSNTDDWPWPIKFHRAQ